jgi:hypothetical protein
VFCPIIPLCCVMCRLSMTMLAFKKEWTFWKKQPPWSKSLSSSSITSFHGLWQGGDRDLGLCVHTILMIHTCVASWRGWIWLTMQHNLCFQFVTLECTIYISYTIALWAFFMEHVPYKSPSSSSSSLSSSSSSSHYSWLLQSHLVILIEN